MTSPDSYAFLDPWFAALHGLLAVADSDHADSDGVVSLGRDPETDWWLCLSWHSAFNKMVDDQEQSRRQLREWREALILVGACASVKNAAFVTKLRTLSGFEPAPFMELKTHALLPHIKITATRAALHHTAK